MNNRLGFKCKIKGFTLTPKFFGVTFAKAKGGFTLMEMVIYIAILSVIVVLVASSVLAMSKSLSSIQASRKINNFAETSIERIVREIRFANSVDVSGSTFGVNPGTLKLNTINPIDELSTTVEFYQSGTNLMIKEGLGAPEDITPSSLSVTDLKFYDVVVPGVSEAIKIEIEVKSTSIFGDKTEKFYNTVVLKRSY